MALFSHRCECSPNQYTGKTLYYRPSLIKCSRNHVIAGATKSMVANARADSTLLIPEERQHTEYISVYIFPFLRRPTIVIMIQKNSLRFLRYSKDTKYCVY